MASVCLCHTWDFGDHDIGQSPCDLETVTLENLLMT